MKEEFLKVTRQQLFSAGSTRVFSVDKTAKLWDLKGNALASFSKHTEIVTSANFSPDGTRVITASLDKTVKLWDLQGNVLKTFNLHNIGGVHSAVFSPDGTRVLTASADKTVKLWDWQGTPLVEFKGHKEVVRSAVFSPDGTRILTTSDDKTVKLWYTPEAIIQWLKTAPIPQLSEEDKKELGIQ